MPKKHESGLLSVQRSGPWFWGQRATIDLSVRHSGSGELTLERTETMSSQLVRPSHGRMIAGVCAGIADRFGLSPFIVRLAFVLSCLLPGPQFVTYLALWLLLPSERLSRTGENP